MRNCFRKQISLGLLMCAFFAPVAEGAYRSDSDVGLELLDYIENNKRHEKEHALTQEEKDMLEEAASIRANRIKPLDPTKPAPASFTGDELFYDMRTGEAFARGHVRIVQEEGRFFTADEAKGNLKTEDVYIEDMTRLMQLVPLKTRVRLTGFRTSYNYGKETGEMYGPNGKVGKHYIRGKKIDFFPDKMVIYEGVATKCSAKKPDYRWEAEVIEIFQNDIAILHDVDFYIGGMLFLHKDKFVVKLNEDKSQTLPRVGYNDDDGWWIKMPLTTKVMDKVYIDADLAYYSRNDFKSSGNLRWENGGNSFKVQYGYYEDADERWIKKSPSFKYRYTNSIGDSAFNYALSYEHGRWSQKNTRFGVGSIRSIHRYYEVALWHNPIEFFDDFKLHLSGSYGITRESYNDSKVTGFSYSAVVTKEISPNVAAYTGYSYSPINSQNTVFDYDLDSYSHKLQYGISIKVTDRDRFVFGQEYDASGSRMARSEYYWFHDMHCAQFILRYKYDHLKSRGTGNRGSWHVKLQFTPW